MLQVEVLRRPFPQLPAVPAGLAYGINCCELYRGSRSSPCTCLRLDGGVGCDANDSSLELCALSETFVLCSLVKFKSSLSFFLDDRSCAFREGFSISRGARSCLCWPVAVGLVRLRGCPDPFGRPAPQTPAGQRACCSRMTRTRMGAGSTQRCGSTAVVCKSAVRL